MNRTIHLTDNYSKGAPIPYECIPDILRIANIGNLQNEPELLVFPHSFAEQKDGIAAMTIYFYSKVDFSFYVYKNQSTYLKDMT